MANTRQVKLDWVGDSDASLVWIILAASILGWLLEIAASVGSRLSRTPSPRATAPGQ